MLAVKIAYYFLLAFTGIFLYVRFYEAKALFLPSRKISATPQDIGLSFEDIFFNTSDRLALNGWFVKSPRLDGATVLFLHGNAGNIGDRLDKIALFYKMGLNVFVMDYRGYGKSQGHPTESGMYRDAQAAYDYLKNRKDVRADKIIFYGESLGNAAAVDLATRVPVAGLIAEGAFSSARDMAKVILPIVPTFLLNVKMDSIAKIEAVKAPKLFIHSPYDEVVPFKLARKLFDAAPAPKEFLEIDGDHNEGYALSYAVYRDGIEAFLKKFNLIP